MAATCAKRRCLGFHPDGGVTPSSARAKVQPIGDGCLEHPRNLSECCVSNHPRRQDGRAPEASFGTSNAVAGTIVFSPRFTT